MFLPDFLASWSASACGTLIMHPVDTLGVRYQTRNHSPLYTLRNERWIALYSGMLTPVTVGGPINALVFMSNDGIKEAVYRGLLRAGLVNHDSLPPSSADNNANNSSNSDALSSSSAYASSSQTGSSLGSSHRDAALMGPKLPMWAVMLSGGLAGCVGTLVACPAATIRVQQQVRAISSHLGGGAGTASTGVGGAATGATATLTPTSSSTSTTSVSAMGKRNLAPVTVVVRDLFMTEGIRGFYRAVSLECATNFIGRSTYFGLYEGFKRLFGAAYISSLGTESLSPDEAELLVSVRIAAASVSSIISWWSIYPLDLIKNKLQAEPTVRSQRLYGNGTIRDCARLTYKAGGWRAFYVGFPITAIRGSCTGMINLPLYDTLKPMFRQQMAPSSALLSEGIFEIGPESDSIDSCLASPSAENSG